jgi:serine/threonine-protein kinase RsbW
MEIRDMAHIQNLTLMRQKFHAVPFVELRQSFSSQVTAISPLVDQLMMFIRNCRKTDGSELEIETAVREAIANAIIHGNHEDPHKRVRVMCRCNSDGEVRITVRDEGPGFQIDAVPDPTSPENRLSTHGRGTYLIRMLMDEVSFVKGGSVVRMRKKSNADGATQRTERSDA